MQFSIIFDIFRFEGKKEIKTLIATLAIAKTVGSRYPSAFGIFLQKSEGFCIISSQVSFFPGIDGIYVRHDKKITTAFYLYLNCQSADLCEKIGYRIQTCEYLSKHCNIFDIRSPVACKTMCQLNFDLLITGSE